MRELEIFSDHLGFEWDLGNHEKNWLKHRVAQIECEQIFFNKPILIYEDIKHSQAEKRYYILGKTNTEKYIYAVFTIRNKLIRVISARPMNKKERSIYEKA